MTRATFILLTFNQERYVAEAVRAALNQDYPNLQIILSDDRSTDSTFAILQSEAAAHAREDVIARQTGRNLGLTPHLYEAVSLADGDLIVIGAGDDISRPNRVSQLVKYWETHGGDALFSNWDVIDSDGKIARYGRPAGRSDLRLHAYFPGLQPLQITGATSAYTRAVFDNVRCPIEPVFAEDLYFTLMMGAWRRRVGYVDKALVAYREHEGAMTHNSRAIESVDADERRVQRESGRIAALLETFERSVASTENKWGRPGTIDWKTVRQDADFNRFRSRWMDAGLGERFRAFRRFPAPSQRRWMLPRLFGLRTLAMLKRLRRRS